MITTTTTRERWGIEPGTLAGSQAGHAGHGLEFLGGDPTWPSPVALAEKQSRPILSKRETGALVFQTPPISRGVKFLTGVPRVVDVSGRHTSRALTRGVVKRAKRWERVLQL